MSKVLKISTPSDSNSTYGTLLRKPHEDKNFNLKMFIEVLFTIVKPSK